jgi:hypothetical protein
MKYPRTCFLFAASRALGLPLAALSAAPFLLSAASPVIYNFQGGSTDGANPKRPVVFNSSGQMFATTVYGGSTGNGIVFELTPSGGSWSESSIYNFLGGTDGAEPDGALVLNGGVFYGTTSIGGSATGSGSGTVFDLSSSAGSWTEKVLYRFHGSSGASPYAGLALNGSVYYGTTYNGGATAHGVVFSMTHGAGGWTEAVVYPFAGPPNDGANPHAPVTIVSATLMYGTTYNGGNSALCSGGCGTVFKLQQTGGVWTETALYNFGATSTDGKNPHGQVVVDSNGVIYGTTLTGGTHGAGTVFSLTPSPGNSWTYAVIHEFTGGANDGAEPRAGLIIAPTTGVLYGTTTEGGGSKLCTGGCGTVYSMTLSSGVWTESVLYKFLGGTGSGADGAQPYADLVLSKGYLYGETYAGGTSTACAANDGCGTVFALKVP